MPNHISHQRNAIKTIMKYTPITMAKMKKTDNSKCKGNGANELLIQRWQECKSVQPSWKTVWQHLLTLNICTPYDSSMSLSGAHLNVYLCAPGDLHKNIHRSTIDNSQPPMSVDSTNHGLKTNSRKFQKAKLEFAVCQALH